MFACSIDDMIQYYLPYEVSDQNQSLINVSQLNAICHMKYLSLDMVKQTHGT